MAKKLIYFFVILLTGLLVFAPTFKTSLYGDEWKVLWIGYSSLEKSGSPIPIYKGDLPYAFEVVSFYFLSKVFGLQSQYYYLISFTTRFLASLVFFWFLKRRKFSSFLAFLGGLLFMISPIGLEATDWVRNFDSYIGISLMLIAVHYILTLKTFRKGLLIISLFFLIVLINTTRSHGVFLILSLLLLIKLFAEKKTKRIYLYTLLTISTFFGFLVNTKLFGGQIEEISSEFPFRVFVESFLGNFGNTLVPNNPSQLLSFLSITAAFLIWKKELFLKHKAKAYPFVLLHIIVVTTVSFVILKAPLNFKTSVAIGGYLLATFLLSLFWELYKRDYTSLITTAFLLGISSAFTIFPLVRIPLINMESEHRYIIYSALATPYIVIIALNEIFKHESLLLKVISVTAVFALIINFSIQSNKFLNLFYDSHNILYTQKVWSQITKYFENYDFSGNAPGVIIMTDNETYPNVNNSIYFGFGFHFALIYEIWKEEMIPPSWVIVGEEIDKSKVPAHVISPDRDIFVFEIKEDEVKLLTPKAIL